MVAAQAGKALKKSTMELGGADAFVVLADADLAKTTHWAVFGRHWNAGQVCVFSKRMIIATEVYDEFLERYAAGVAGLRAGDPYDATTILAPLCSQAAVNDLRDKIRQAVAHGARATEVGPEVPDKGAFVQPTGMVFVNHPTMVKADLPFGGIRRSGYGRELLGLGIKEFVNHKLIDVVDIDAEF